MAKSLTRLFRRFLTYILWLVSLLVIVFVLVVSVIKLSLPYWTENKDRMIALLEDKVGGDFNYSSLEVDWSEFKPSIFVNGISWSSESKDQSYRAGKAHVVLNFWESLFKGYLVTESVDLNSVNAEIMLPQLAGQETPLSTDFGILLKRYPEMIDQESISITDFSINLHKKDETRKIQISDLSFTKRGKQRQLIVESQSAFASQARLIIESKGQPFVGNSPIKIYGLLRDFDVVDSTSFFELPQGIPVELADSEFWVSYQGEDPVSGRLIFSADSSSSKVAALNSEINYQVDGALSIFSSDQFHVVERTESGELRSYDSFFKLVRHQKESNTTDWILEAENTPIGYFSALVSPFLPSDLRNTLNQVQPTGELVSLDMEATQSEHGLVPKFGSAEIINVQTQQSRLSPRMSLDRILINNEGEGWRLKADSKNSELQWDKELKGIIPVKQLTLDAWVSYIDTPYIDINGLTFTTPDLDVAVNGSVRIIDEDAELSIYAEAKNINIAKLEDYWPRSHIEDDVLDFLDMALVAGRVDFAKLTWRGNFEQFPYQNNTGQFDIKARVVDSQFRFDEAWPIVDGLSASVHFTNNEVLMTAHQGSIMGNTVEQAKGVIESLFTEGSVLTLDVSNRVAFDSYKQLFLNSPLKEWLGEELLDLEFSGSLKNQLSATVPLSENSDDITLNGEIEFAGESVELKSYQLALNNLRGILNYSERGASAKQLNASLWQSPVTIDIAVDEYTNNDDLVNIDANSNFDLAKAVASLDIQLPIYVEGKSQANLHYRQDSEGSESLIVRSDLAGTEIKGPSWVSKEKDAQSSFLATLYRKKNRIHARTIYRDTVSSQLDFGVDTPNDINGVIALGDLATHSIKVPAKGVAIEGFFAEIHSAEWLNSLQVKKEGEFFWPEWIDHISIQTALFTIGGQSLHDVVFTDSLLADESIRFNVKAREGLGNLTLHNDGRKHVTIEKLEIELDTFSELSDTEVNISKSALDNWQLECLSCKINGIDIGRLTLLSKLENGAVKLQGDTKIDGQLSAYLEGLWAGDKSSVDLTFDTQDTGKLLKRWGYGDGISQTKASGSVKLNWTGGFHEFSLPQLNGQVKLETGEGAVKELSDRQARVFSLFSLQSVRRRLSLDFSDLFEDGFFYDKMNGEFTVKNGVVHSDNVFIDGTAADVRVKGSIDLVKQTVNQNVTVVPKLGASLPVLAGWAVEPTTGLIMLLVNKIFEPVIDVVVSIEYKVSGNLANPSVVEVSKKSKEVAVPDTEDETEEVENTDKVDKTDEVDMSDKVKSETNSMPPQEQENKLTEGDQ
ncbi:YhdP family protein [Kangiella marina]|uniref:YhdP central domain-containing protein n=1 Tax=Kangiella marina TaxID=1079178 RepID=A0ABP8IN24_9GAMM